MTSPSPTSDPDSMFPPTKVAVPHAIIFLSLPIGGGVCDLLCCLAEFNSPTGDGCLLLCLGRAERVTPHRVITAFLSTAPCPPRLPLPMTTFLLELSLRLQTADPQAAGGCFGDRTGHGPTCRSDYQPGFGSVTSHPLSAAGGDSKPGAALGGPGWMGLGLALGPEGDALKLE